MHSPFRYEAGFTSISELNMLQSKHLWNAFFLLIAAAVLSGCAVLNAEGPYGINAEDDGATKRFHKADLPTHEIVQYYIGKLPDRGYVDTYGGDEHPRPWYTAAEALGEIGKPAVPALIKRLDTPDPYELKLVLYALMLASQDQNLRAETNDDYLRLNTVLTQNTNKENRERALDWWQRFRHLWQ